ncbi:MAG: helix-turn-helix domain-containing protein [Aeromonas salmonicida]
MSFTRILEPQNRFLEGYLRGTGRTLTARDARARFGIANLRARMSELRSAGLRVQSEPTRQGTLRYRVPARDVTGRRARIFG